MSDQITATCSIPLFQHQTVCYRDPASQQPCSDNMSSQSKWMNNSTEDTDLVISEDGLSNGTCEVETLVVLRCHDDSGDVTIEADPVLSNDDMSEFSNSDLSLPEVCISTNSNSFEDDMNYEVQQAYRIFTGLLLEKHKSITTPFLHPIGHQEVQHGIGGVRGLGQSPLKQSMCLQRMEEKFMNQEYDTITEFVADFRLMLENCYRCHGVDHWISKQAQKLEIMLEQKLTLLSRTLREKTTLAVTSKGRFGAEEERGSGGTSTRRRLAPRSLATITVGGHESIMVQTLRLEEQQRVKDEKRQRELEKKEAEEMSAKEVEEWEQNLLSQAALHTVDTLWELPAIGHFLCLAQTALNLPEIVFFELERCLLMPRCSLLLSKIMSSLLSPPQRRVTLHRRPALPYRRWESELRQRVMGWYRAIGAARDQQGRAEQLGLCHQFFRTLGEVNPLIEKPFHLLSFYQRVWLLKGLCDHVYETQKDVQEALLSQPIHECRESILGYDSKENAYIHFPHFCGADLRIYRQSPSTPPALPLPSSWVRRVEMEPVTEGEESDGMKDKGLRNEKGCYGDKIDTGEYGDFGNGKAESQTNFTGENGDDEEDKKQFKSWSLKEEVSDSVSSDEDPCEDPKVDLNTNSLSPSHPSPIRESGLKMNLKEEMVHQSKKLTLKQEQGFTLHSTRTIKAETKEPCLSVGEHCYMGRSPARSVDVAFTRKPAGLKVEGGSLTQGHHGSSCSECCKHETDDLKSEDYNCSCGTPRQLSSESTQNSSEEKVNDKMWTKKKKRKKKRRREQLPRVKGEHKQLQHVDRMRLSPVETAKSVLRRVSTTIKRKEKKKKHKAGKKVDTTKKIEEEPSVEPSFKLVCTSLEELRDLISKTEDELDDLESTKKRLGRWYYRREAVKDLHSTLIRLLNELSPWEPKLVKAYQRNRLRLKKEFEDFKNHPEYNNFVREECISSSSSSDDEGDDSGFGKETSLHTDHYRRSEEEDLEHVVPRGLWSGASTREFLAESSEERTMTNALQNHIKQPPEIPEKDIHPLERLHSTSTPDTGPPFRSELPPSNQSGDSNSAWAARLSPRPPVLHPTTGLPKGYTPIPTLLAKSVGNKVTLMKRPADCPRVNDRNKQRKDSSASLSTSTVTTTKFSKAQNSPSISPQNPKQTQRPQQTEVVRHTGTATASAALQLSPQAKTTQTVPKSSAQVIYKVPERLGHIVQRDSSCPVKISVHPVLGQNTGEKIMQQVVILPSNLLVKNTEDKGSSLDQQPCKGIQVPVPKVVSPLCMSTNVPGFTIPENKVAVQQVAPLKDALSPSVCPYLHQGATNTAGSKLTQACTPHGSTTQGIPPKPSTNLTSTTAGSADPIKSTVPKQELKTVCIRDSQSILVTTRGGNTGIVKVQTSSDKNVLGSSSSTPVITISPQFKAFLVSKTSQTPPSQTSSCTIPAVTSMQPQQVPSVLKSPSSVTAPVYTAVTGSLPIPGTRCQSSGTTVAPIRGSITAAVSTVATKVGHKVQVASADSPFQASLVKNTVVVPSLSSSGISPKTGMKRQSQDDRSQVTKFILVSPSSSSTSNVASSKSTLSSANPVPTSRVMFISQPTVTSPIAPKGSDQKHGRAAGAGGQLLSTSLQSHTLKVGVSPGQTVGGIKNITLPAGVQIQLTGKTTTIGQTIGALSRSPSKSTPVSDSIPSCPTATTIGLVPVITSNTIPSSSAQFASHTSLTTSSKYQGISSVPVISSSSSSTSTSTASSMPAGNLIQKDNSILSSESPAQVTTSVQSSPAQTSSVICQPFKLTGDIGIAKESLSSSSELALPQSRPTLPSATTTNTPVTTSAAGTIQQRIVINTSTPLAAGTQILLNNARFVVPPQGLGPGSHVLIISSPSPQEVPTASAVSTATSVNQVTPVPQSPVLPQLPVRQPSVPALSSPFVASSPARGPAKTPSVIPVQPKSLSSVSPSETNVSALLRLPGGFTSPPGSSPSLVSSQPRLVGVPALVSPSAPVLGSALATISLAAGAPVRAESSQTVAPTLSRLSAPLSSFSLLPSPSAVPMPNPVITVPATNSSAAGTTALHSSVPAQQMVLGPGTQPRHMATGIASHSPSLTQALVHTGLENTSYRKTVPAGLQPVLTGIRTHVLPTTAVSPVESAVPRMQTLPIATIQPLGSTINTCETPPSVTTPSTNSTVIISPGQTTSALKTNNSIHPPIGLTNQALGRHCLLTSSLGLSSKLLISPDGAVLSTVQGQVSAAELTTCPKTLNAPLARSTGAAHETSLQADRKCTN